MAEVPQQNLTPFFAAPLRPGETLEGISVRGRSNIDQLTTLVDLPFMAAELGYWVVPLSTLGPQFIDLLLANAEDSVSTGNTANPGSAWGNAQGSLAEQGHMTPGYQFVSRPWAGEIGGNDGAGVPITGSQYVPYTSHATYAVARAWYELDLGTVDYSDQDLFDNPPILGQYIQGALRSGFDQGTFGLDPDLSAVSLSEMIERLYLMSQPEYTYAEMLAAHGVDPMKVGGLPQPVMIEQMVLSDQSNGGFLPSGVTDDVAVNQFSSSHNALGSLPFTSGGASASLIAPNSPYGMAGCRWNASRSRGLFITEPSILLGTLVWWTEELQATTYAEHLDMNRMTHPGHWGNVMNGGIEEGDFLAVQGLYGVDGETIIDGSQTGQDAAASHVFNLMNLYLKGDTFKNAKDGSADRFRREGFSGVAGTGSHDLTSNLSTQLRIRSDLVS